MSVATLIMLVAQYGLGMFLNLYVAVPASDAHAGVFTEIATAPLALTVHALLGLALIGTAVLLLVRAVSVGDRPLAVLGATGLTAIGGAFAAGEIFVKNGQPGASMAMGVLTGAALLCYVGTLALATAARRQAAALDRPVPLPVRPPRPRDPLTPPSGWPATPARGVPARPSRRAEPRRPAEDGRAAGDRWAAAADRWAAGDGWPAEEGWTGPDSWAAEDSWAAGEGWPDGEGWPGTPSARPPGPWFARD